MKTLKLLTLAAFSCAFSSCGQSTGDPTQGGLFGWSEGKAQDRQNAKRREYYGIKNDTDDLNKKNSSLQRKVNSSEAELKKY